MFVNLVYIQHCRIYQILIKNVSQFYRGLILPRQNIFYMVFLAVAELSVPAKAQIRLNDAGSTGRAIVCQENGVFVYGVVGDCYANEFRAPVPQVSVGPVGSETTLDAADGSATFNSSATFNGGTLFRGNVSLTGLVRANQIDTGTILNSGSISTSSLSTNSFRANGAGTFTGLLTANSFFSNSATIAALRVPGDASFDQAVTVGGRLTASQGLVVGAASTIDVGGNRVQNVSAPLAGTDAANKAYVDGAVVGVQGGIATLSSQVVDHETRIAAAETVTVEQITRLTSIESVNTVQNSRLSSIETLNTIQSTQLNNLQDQVGSLQNSVNGLQRNIKEANGGIVAAVALGGTMVVPDSKVSVSFNLATYRGQQGFSGSVVGRVGRKVYVNAGVGASTVRGSTAGRVGISFGL